MQPDFKKWYEERHQMPYPGEAGELLDTVIRRLADAFAEYADERLQQMEQDISDIKSHLVL